MESPEGRPPVQPPWLFQSQGLLLLLLVAAVAAAFTAADLALLASILLVIGVAARLWTAVALRRVTYRRAAQTLRAFRGESVQVETTLSNRKPVPLPWAEVWERVPLALAPEGDAERSLAQPETAWVCHGAALWPYKRARWRSRFVCRRRGVYRLEEVHVRSGDPFGLLDREMPVSSGRVEVIVYPRVVPLQRLSIPIQFPSLDAAGARSLISDPTRTATLRAYAPGDPIRLIHWPTTARRNQLQVRVPEPATSLSVSLVLDVRGYSVLPYDPADQWVERTETYLETAVSALASVAVFLHRRGASVGLLVNTAPRVSLPAGARTGHIQAVLEALARLTTPEAQPLEPLVRGLVRRGSTVVIVASSTGPDLPGVVARLRSDGYAVVPLLAGPETVVTRTVPGVVHLTSESNLAATLEARA